MKSSARMTNSLGKPSTGYYAGVFKQNGARSAGRRFKVKFQFNTVSSAVILAVLLAALTELAQQIPQFSGEWVPYVMLVISVAITAIQAYLNEMQARSLDSTRQAALRTDRPAWWRKIL